MLTFEIAHFIGHRWIDTWNTKSIDDYLELFTDNVVVVSSIALRLFPESNGRLKDKKVLKNYWELVKRKFPEFIFELTNLQFTENKIIVFFASRNKEVKAIAILTIVENNQITMVEVSYV